MANEQYSNAIVSSSKKFDAAGALPIDVATINLQSTAARACTLADGVDGQRLRIKMSIDGGDVVVTPANYSNGSTITFDAVGELVDLEFDEVLGWVNVTVVGATVA